VLGIDRRTLNRMFARERGMGHADQLTDEELDALEREKTRKRRFPSSSDRDLSRVATVG